MRPAQQLTYGEHADQWLEVSACPPDAACGIALIHGGYWRDHLTADLTSPIARRYEQLGYAVANVEYRRGPTAVWPAPVNDVTSALAAFAAYLRERTGGDVPIITMGHSVGGQLALLNAASAAGIVAIAPVTDAARTHAEALGEGAAAEYFGVAPDRAPKMYADASPIAHLPVGTPTLLVHGADDDRVPLRHSLDFLDASWSEGDDIDALLRSSLPHRAPLDPAHDVWRAIDEWITSRFQAARDA